jgi:hypothetical protein
MHDWHLPLVFRAHVRRVISYDCLRADIDLRFGVTIQREVHVEGISRIIASVDAEAAAKCVSTMVGGRKVVIQIHSTVGNIAARVYAAEYAPSAPVAQMGQPDGAPCPLVDVAAWLSWSVDNRYDLRLLRAALKG